MLGGLLLASLVLGEALPRTRLLGAFAIVVGLSILAGEAALTIGTNGILGDLSFAAAGLAWAGFGLLIALWRIDALRAVGVVSALTLFVYVPLHALLFGFAGMLAAGWAENLLQIAVQGGLAGPCAIYLYTLAVKVLGAGRAAIPGAAPGFTARDFSFSAKCRVWRSSRGWRSWRSVSDLR